MSSSSRSIAAARQRRSGEVVQKPQAPPQNFKQNIGQKPQQPVNKMQAQSQGQMQAQMQRPKLSIGDAIGLVTLRLGRVEEFMIRAQNPEGGLKLGGSASIPENSQMIDKSVFTNMISRLDSLEKKDSNKQLAALESELKSTKDLLISLMAKFEKFSKETDEKFADYDCAIAEIEGKMDSPCEPIDEAEEVVSSELTAAGVAGVEGITFEISESTF
jgi:hypothetical protein